MHYYDTFVKEHAGCKTNALRLLEALQVKVEADALERKNLTRQREVECGHLVCHYIEEHLRRHKGEGWATTGWPKQRMKTLKSSLVA